MTDPAGRGRDAFDRRAWGRAYEELSAASVDEPLEVPDLERLAAAAYLIGRSAESFEVWERAHHECARIGEIARAARCAFWIGFALLNGGEFARGGGWIDRAQRLLDDRKLDCVEQGYLRYGYGLRAVFTEDVEAAHIAFREAVGIGERFLDPELTTLARIGEGRCLIYLGDTGGGLALLDEAMVAVGAREVSAVATGDAYCTVIEGCREVFDVRRSSEWTAALSVWCEEQPDLVLYRGECLVHRAEVLQLRGAWAEALDQIERALQRIADPSAHRIHGGATYLRGDLHRLRGEFAEAEAAYRVANASGHSAQPGLALLRLAQGQSGAALASITRALEEAEDPITRARILGPFVEIVLAGGEAATARDAALQLASVADDLNQPFLKALTAHAKGMVLLAEGDPAGALAQLRGAWKGWRDLEVPHEAAKARVLIALACQALGDADGADMELDAARSAFVALGAIPDVARLDSLLPPPAGALPGGLTAREGEVLALVAKGKTNRQIATELVISEKTVASHLNHMFTKLGLTSRAAATAYAYEHGLAESTKHSLGGA